MKWVWLGLLALVVIVVVGLIQSQGGNKSEGFATIDYGTAKAQRQLLQLEGERRYNDLGRIQNLTLPSDAVSDALNQIIPVASSKDGASLLTSKGMGLFEARDDGTGKDGDGVEKTGALLEKIAFCENLADNNCSALDDPRYSECGICHKAGISSKGQRHRGGMYISADDQIRANEVAKTDGTRAEYRPTFGKCDPANFTVMKDTCIWKGRTIECETLAAPSSNNECGQCFGGSGDMLYVGPKPKKFEAVLNISHPGTGFVYVNNTTKLGGQTLPAGNMNSILDPKQLYLELAEGENIKITITNMPIIWCAWLSSPDGKRTVSIDVGVHYIDPQGAIVVAGDKRSRKIEKTMSAVSGWEAYKATVPSTAMWYLRRVISVVPPSQPFDCTPGGKSPGYPSSDNRIRLYDRDDCSTVGGRHYTNGECLRTTGGSFSWDCRTLNDTTPKSPPVAISLTIPATLADPFYDVDVPNCPGGPLVLTEGGAGMMGAHSCYDAKGKFNPTIYCLSKLFEAAGGTTAGTLYPDTAAKAAALVVNGSLDQTVDWLNNYGSIALYGTDNNGAPVGFAAQKDAALKFLGIRMSSPCDGPNSRTGPHSKECLDHLWRTSGNAAQLGQNVDPASVPYAYCSANGWAPQKSSAMSQWVAQHSNNIGDIQSIRNWYHAIYQRAQDSSDFDSQKAHMEACYGVKIEKPKPDCATNKCNWIAAANAAQWVKIEGEVRHAAIGNDNKIIVTNAGYGTYSRDITSSSPAWTNLVGMLSQVDTKGGISVGVSNMGVHSGQYGGPIFKATKDTQWEQLPGAAIWISVGVDGDIWCVNKVGNIYHWNGTNDWIFIPGVAFQVSVGDAQNVWVCNGNAIYKWQNSTWKHVPTPVQVKQVAVSAGGTRLITFGTDGNIYGSANDGSSWTQIMGNFNGSVSINDDYLIASNTDASRNSYNWTLYSRKITC